MTTPLGWHRRRDGGLRGTLARWWGRRRVRKIRAALDSLH